MSSGRFGGETVMVQADDSIPRARRSCSFIIGCPLQARDRTYDKPLKVYLDLVCTMDPGSNLQKPVRSLTPP